MRMHRWIIIIFVWHILNAEQEKYEKSGLSIDTHMSCSYYPAYNKEALKQYEKPKFFLRYVHKQDMLKNHLH